MFDLFLQFDREFFMFINSHYNKFWDFIMFWLSNKLIWIPFYIAISLIILKTYNKQFFFMIFFIGILITCSDQLSVVIKDFVQRPRPCHNMQLQPFVHLVNGYCGGSFGFVSSHASNSMALITFLFLACNARIKWLKYLMVPWAIIISYSRVYLGVHYPFDIIAGWCLGILLGILIYYFYVLVAQSKRGPLKYH